MQIVNNILRIAGGETTVTDDYGKKVAAPAVKIGISYLLELDLRSDVSDEETGVLLPLPWEQISEAQSFYLCVDGDWDKDTTPKLLSASNISIEQSEDGRTLLIAALPNTLREALIEAVNKKKNVSLMCEIGGYKVTDETEGTTETIFCVNFDLILQNRLYYNDGEFPEDITTNPEYLTRSETIALINEFLQSDVPGPDGKSAYQIAQELGFAGTEAEWIESLKGAAGDSAYAVAVAEGFEGTEQEWLNSLKGRDGLSAYALAVQNGYPGTLTSWLEDLKGENGESAYQIAVRVQGFEGTEQEWLQSLHGKDGAGIQYDAFGIPSDRSLYDGEAAGFRYLSSVNDDGIRVNYVYIWEKTGSGPTDWSEPLIIKNYGNTQTKFDIIKPAVMDYWDNSVYDYFQIDLKLYPYAMITQVTLDTAEGEQVLPFGSSFGVEKVVFINTGESDTGYTGRIARIYFGKNIPTWTRGRIYLSQMVAPEDITLVVPAAKAIMYYGYIQSAGLSSVTAITDEILEAAISAGTMIKADAKVLTKTSLGIVPAGAFVTVIVPENFTASKDNGFNGIVEFSENNGQTGTGANGAEITLSDVKYKVYGEFKLTNSEVFFYVSNN